MCAVLIDLLQFQVNCSLRIVAGGLQGTCKLADYCASKFGAYGFNESLRRELLKAVCSFVIIIVVS